MAAPVFRFIKRLEVLCICLRRLAYPCRFADVSQMFHRPKPELCVLFKVGIDFIYDQFSDKLTNLNQPWLTVPQLERYCAAIHAKGAPLEFCWGMVDGTIRSMCRPGHLQQEVYNGHKRVHSLKFQCVMTPNGLVANVFGPLVCRRHDAALLNGSGILEHMQQHMVTPTGDEMYLYGDRAYPLTPNLMRPYRGHITEEQQAFNTEMSREEEEEEEDSEEEDDDDDQPKQRKRTEMDEDGSEAEDTSEISGGRATDIWRQQLHEEFTAIMREQFLSGKDVQFDYSKVDDNPDYDSLDTMGQDEEYQYFLAEPPQTVGQDEEYQYFLAEPPQTVGQDEEYQYFLAEPPQTVGQDEEYQYFLAEPPQTVGQDEEYQYFLAEPPQTVGQKNSDRDRNSQQNAQDKMEEEQQQEEEEDDYMLYEPPPDLVAKSAHYVKLAIME